MKKIIELERVREISFFPNHLRRHLVTNQNVIYTTRRSAKGSPGDFFCIEGVSGIWQLSECECFTTLAATSLFYSQEGFENSKEFYTALKEIYPEIQPLDNVYVHLLNRVRDVKVLPGFIAQAKRGVKNEYR